MMDSQENVTVNNSPVEETVNQEVEKVEEQAAPESQETLEEQVAPEVPETPEAQEIPEAPEIPEVQEEAPEAPEAPAEPKTYATKAEVLDRVKELAHGEEMPQKDEVDYLKTVFYKLHIAEREARLKEYIDGGGDPEAYQITPDVAEEAFKADDDHVRNGSGYSHR